MEPLTQLERERRAQGKMRRTVRGWRAIERRVLEERRTTTAPEPTAQPERAKTAERPRAHPPAVAAPPRAGTPEPCASSARGVRRPEGARDATGWRGAGEAAGADEGGAGVRGAGHAPRQPGRSASPARLTPAGSAPRRAGRVGPQPAREKRGAAAAWLRRRAGGMDRGRALARAPLAPVGRDAKARQAVDDPLQPHTHVPGEARETPCMGLRQPWQSRADPREPHGATRLRRFAPGVLGGGEVAEVPADHGALARGCKGPKGPERRRPGRRHAGVRIVRQGPTLRLARAAQGHHDGPCTVDDLEPYGQARVPARPQEAVERGTIRRQARSRKKRPILLADLEKRYMNAL